MFSTSFKNIVLQFLFSAVIFAIPTNFFKKLFELQSYVNGLQIDYLIPKLYLSDVFIILIFATLIFYQFKETVLNKNWLLEFKEKTKEIVNFKTFSKFVNTAIFKKENLMSKTVFISSLTLIVLFQQLLNPQPVVSVLFLSRFLVLLYIAVFLKKQHILEQLLESKVVVITVQLTIVFQSFVAWYQFLFQKSLFGYRFLGETNLQSYAGLAKTTINGVEKILPYGTTAHPNVLGGTLALFVLFLLFQARKNSKMKQLLPVILVGAITVFLTQSVSAVLALLLGTLLLFYKPTVSAKQLAAIYTLSILASILFLHISVQTLGLKNTSLTRRNYLNQASFSIIQAHPFLGIGAKNFTVYLEKYSDTQEVVRFVQPVHNTFLLFLSEYGFLGLAILLMYIDYFKTHFIQKNEGIQESLNSTVLGVFFIAVLPIIVWDHYFLSIQTGILLLWISILWSMTTE